MKRLFGLFLFILSSQLQAVELVCIVKNSSEDKPSAEGYFVDIDRLAGTVIKFGESQAAEFEPENSKSEYYLLSQPEEGRVNRLFTIYKSTGNFKYMMVNNNASGTSAFNTAIVHTGTCYRKGKQEI